MKLLYQVILLFGTPGRELSSGGIMQDDWFLAAEVEAPVAAELPKP